MDDSYLNITPLLVNLVVILSLEEGKMALIESEEVNASLEALLVGTFLVGHESYHTFFSRLVYLF